MVINVTDTFKRAEYIDIISANIVLLDTTPMPVMRTRGNMIGKLRSFLTYFRDHGSAYIYGKHYTGVSIRKLANLYGGSWTTWEKYIHVWIEHGLLGAPDHSASENNIFEINAKEYARLSGENTTQQQCIPLPDGRRNSYKGSHKRKDQDVKQKQYTGVDKLRRIKYGETSAEYQEPLIWRRWRS